ncbi:unnamed protein product [Protopolystoma xenopodis]|uniref:Uncharacterized protein n=1 Tax=Protopolystoma xenopodis TaxID=117903 RepID=A0A448WED1_9PLAT|nr:unnamed protein product [Protopolystoma xenopodis]
MSVTQVPIERPRLASGLTGLTRKNGAQDGGRCEAKLNKANQSSRALETLPNRPALLSDLRLGGFWACLQDCAKVCPSQTAATLIVNMWYSIRHKCC